MILYSRFKYWVLLSAMLLITFFTLFVFVLRILLQSLTDNPTGLYIALFLFGFAWIWLLFGELRTKIVRVSIGNGQLKVTRYFGLAKAEVYSLSDFEGFVTADLASRYGDYEYLYLVIRGRRRIAISQFYHRNYSEMKDILAISVRNMGKRHISIVDHLKDIFL